MATYEQFEKVFRPLIKIGGNMEKEDNTFTATCKVSSIESDDRGDYTDLNLHNEKTGKDYRVRAWHNTITPQLDVGEVAKFKIGRVVKQKDGKNYTFFNLLAVDIPEIDVNEDVATPKKDEAFSYKETTSLFQTKMNGAVSIWCAMVAAGKDLELGEIDNFYLYLENFQRQKLG